MQPLALLGAIAGALLGALGWAGLAHGTGYELGFVAWGIGGLVGWATVLFGGRGPVSAVAASLLTLLAIFGGKMLSARLELGQRLEEDKVIATRNEYDELVADAEAFAKLRDPEEHAAFMVEHHFSQESQAAAVTTEELEAFRESVAPELERFQERPPEYAAWRAEVKRRILARASSPTLLAQVVTESLDWIDAVFAFLGIGTAFRIVAAASRRPPQGCPVRDSTTEHVEPASGARRMAAADTSSPQDTDA